MSAFSTSSTKTAPDEARVPESFWFLLEDDRLVSSALTRVLRRYAPVRRAASVAEADPLFDHLRRCCGLVLDINLPDGSGLDVLERIRSRKIGAPAIVITGQCRHDQISRAQRLGAQFLWKPWSPENLKAFAESALREAARSEVAASWEQFFPDRKPSPRETEVLLQAMADSTPEQIAASLDVSPNTVKTLLKRIKDKAGVASIAELRQRLKLAHGRPRRQAISGPRS